MPGFTRILFYTEFADRLPAYVKNKGIELSGTEHGVAGLLLYARTDEPIVPNQSYRMGGNTISVRTPDLNRDFADMRSQMDGMCSAFFA